VFRSFALSDAQARESTVSGYNLFMSPQKTEFYLKRKREKPCYTKCVDPDAVCNTLRAGYLKSRGNEALVARGADGELTAEPGDGCSSLRMLALAEVKTMQSFPQSYAFSGGAGAVYRQIGNAMPPRLARALGRGFSE
jgi:site-specific DNA-cytosine methylase